VPTDPDQGGQPINYYVGKGIVYWTPDGGAERDVGNVPQFEFTPAVELLDHNSSRTGVKTRDRRVVTQKTGTLRMVMDEWNAPNLALMLMGDITPAGSPLAVTGDVTSGSTAVTGITPTTGLVVGEEYAVSGSAEVPDGTTLVYDAAGAGTLSAPATATNATAAMTLTLPESINIFSLSEQKGQIRFEGTNDIGPRVRLMFPSVTFTPSSAIQPISDEWGTMEVTGDVLAVNGVFGRAYISPPVPEA
jgi:hypothetical protein